MAQRNRNNKGIGEHRQARLELQARTAIGAIVVRRAGRDRRAALNPARRVRTREERRAGRRSGQAGPDHERAVDRGRPVQRRSRPVGDARRCRRDLTWQTGRGGITWPVSTAVGPTKKIDGFAACFARTPTGAALAATTGYLGQYDTGHSVRDLMNFYIADSAGKPPRRRRVKRQTSPEDMRAQGISVAGYTVESFTKNSSRLSTSFSPSPLAQRGTSPCH